ncbi:MAG TPA: extracellular solute-binding protein [Candidatus Paceibacterota bacterium]|nr:extracellular solute-binding protein [Candidatus Paceibacterota bacterium]
MTKFQLILTGVFGGFLVLGIIVFAMHRGGGAADRAPVTIWGFVDENDMSKLLEDAGLQNDPSTPVTYVRKDPATFDSDFVSAIADGDAPDLVMVSQDQFYKEKNRLFPIPYSSLDQRTFKDTYVEEAELFMQPDGIYAIPFVMDPYVMYWNRNIFQNAGISQPPQYWDEFYDLARTLTKKDGALNITRSAVGLGEYSNVTHAKNMLATLIIQAGSPITTADSSSGRIMSTFNDRGDNPTVPSEAAINFFTEFSDPAKDTYSWNRSLPDSKDMFISGDLATYFGPASELFEIQAKNPNLNFDVTYMPQSRDAQNKMTFGDLQGLSLVKSSQHIAAAFRVMTLLTSAKSLALLSQMTSLPPVRRDLLSTKPSSPYGIVFYDSAIFAKAWTDPDNTATDKIFGDLIESITSGRSRPTQAITNAGLEIQQLLDANSTAPKAPSSVPTA